MRKNDYILEAIVMTHDDDMQIILSFMHNMPEVIGLSIGDAIENWAARINHTDEVNEDNFVNYINSKHTGYVIHSVEQFIKDHPEDEKELRDSIDELVKNMDYEKD